MRFSRCCQAHVEAWTNPTTAQLTISEETQAIQFSCSTVIPVSVQSVIAQHRVTQNAQASKRVKILERLLQISGTQRNVRAAAIHTYLIQRLFRS